MSYSRRFFVLGTLGLPGCAALSALTPPSPPSAVYELQPPAFPARRRRSSGSLLVLPPAAPAAISTDRILIRENPLSVSYLPDVSWADAVPQMMQAILIRSLSASGRIGFVGAQGSGPVPDSVLLTRIDAFGVTQEAEGVFIAEIACEMTVLRDVDQRILGTRLFSRRINVGDDRAAPIALAFQALVDDLLPDIVDWTVSLAV